MEELRDYIKKYGKLIFVLTVAAFVCYGFLVFSGNIRIDTEELLNAPGSKLGWLTIGRFGLAFLKDLLGLSTHNVVKSGILFFVFFLLGENLFVWAIYHFSGRKKYPYWIFLLLYTTSNIWSYQIYFSVQQAEVAFALCLLVLAAALSMQACFEVTGVARVWRYILACVLIVPALGTYQALAAYYIAVCIVLFLAWLDNEAGGQRQETRSLICGIVGLIACFGISYILYRFVANTWFMATADYMESQMGWGKYPAIECIKNVLRTAKNLLIGNGPRNFSFYTVAVLLTVVAVVTEWRRGAAGNISHFVLKLLALAGIAATPFLMTLYMGEMLVTRSQFALPVAAAFLGMYAIDVLCEGKENKAWQGHICTALVLLTVILQTGYSLQMAYTDHVRYEQDVKKSEELVAALKDIGGGTIPDKPVLFVGYQKPELDRWCGRTEMYGWSFYEWDYSVANPTGATHRIAGFLQADKGIIIRQDATEQMRQDAVELAEQMPVFPEEGSILDTDDFVVVKLSAVTERTDINWW